VVTPSGRPVADAQGAVSGRETASRVGDLVGYTPLFSGPEMYTATEHPKYETVLANRASYAKEETADDDYDPSAAEDRSGSQSVRQQNELYQLSLRDVTGLSSGFRGKNPEAHVGNSEDYFVMLTDEAAYDHKRKALYNALTYMAVEAGPRDISSPSGTFDDEEILETWVHAKEQGYISSDARVPIRALNAAAVEMGVADYSDLTSKEIGSGEDAFTIPQTLPDEQYNAAIDRFESTFGVTPGRQKLTVESDFIDLEVTTENSAAKFGQRYLTSDPPEELCKYEDKPPRTPVATVWKAYQNWCELNGIDPHSEYTGGKKELVKSVDGIEKKKAKWNDDKIQTYYGGKLNAGGWWLYSWTANDASE